MFDINEFKKKIKIWIRENPQGNEAEFLDYCEELIPPAHFSANRWLIDQTVSWYHSILQSRKEDLSHDDEDVH